MQVDLSFEDRYVDLVEQGIDVAMRMGKLADSTLGARFLGMNPWVMVAAPAYLQEHGTPKRRAGPERRTSRSSTAACRATTAGSCTRPRASR